MRLLIIGLDGLDYDLVRKWRLDFYKQRFYGKHYIGFLKKLYTPIVWGCFLTGLDVEEHGYDFQRVVQKRSEEAFKIKVLRKLYSVRRKIPIKDLKVRNLLVKLNLLNPYQGCIMPRDLVDKAFPELLKKIGYKVATIEVPGYDEKRNEYFRSTIQALLSASLNEKNAYVNRVLKEVNERISEAMSYLNNEYDLIFMYSPLPDIAFHLVTKPTLRMKTWLRSVHEKLQKIISPLVEKARKQDHAILMISDHGFDLNKYYHSNYGFWSLNVEPPNWWNIKTILDFKENIMKLILEC